MSTDSYTPETREAIDNAKRKGLSFEVDGKGNVFITEYVNGRQVTRKC